MPGLNELALDQNFPEPILRCLDEYVVDVRLVPLRSIDPRLPTLGDRELVLALHQLGGQGPVNVIPSREVQLR